MKKISYVIITCMTFFFLTTVSYAATLSISATSQTVYVGSTVKITARASSLAGKFSFKSSNSSVLSGGGTTFLDNSSETYTFKANKVGTATISVVPLDASDYDGNVFSTTKSITITVKEYVPASSVNTLKSLSVEGYDLNRNFDSNTVEYEVTVPAGTEKITIKASKTDSDASVNGTGEKSVQEGMNQFNIVVTAANGSKKTYTLKVTVEEKDPIIVTINDNDYTVIRKREDMPNVNELYEETTVTIDEEEIPAYYSDITKFTLVGLKDEEGVSRNYIYDSENNTYTNYQEVYSGRITLYPTTTENIPTGYTKTTITINEQEVIAYEKENEYELVYGMNVETGEYNLYTYDKEENTFQRYLEKDDSISTELMKELFIIVATIFSVLIAIIIALILKLKRVKPQKEKKVKEPKVKKSKGKKIKVTKVEGKEASLEDIKIDKEEG